MELFLSRLAISSWPWQMIEKKHYEAVRDTIYEEYKILSNNVLQIFEHFRNLS